MLLSGTIYTGRDAAHKRIVEALSKGEQPPFPLEGAVIYYVGPSPASSRCLVLLSADACCWVVGAPGMG